MNPVRWLELVAVIAVVVVTLRILRGVMRTPPDTRPPREDLLVGAGIDNGPRTPKPGSIKLDLPNDER